jgi:protein-S-isoprenylcysteine O-methyltransferase Ste14
LFGWRFGAALILQNLRLISLAVIRSGIVQATLFEFRNRWWIFAGLFSVAFLAYAIDQMNTGQAIGNWISQHSSIHVTDNTFRIIFGCAALLQFLAAFLRTWGTSYLQAEVMSDSRIHTEKLLADGPYRYVRNPLYLGNIIMAIAIGVMASRVGFMILVVGMFIFTLRLLLREEAELAKDQSESYLRYCAAVPRLLPSPWPRVPAAGNPAHWLQGFRAELMYWLMAVALGGFAITLKILVFWIGFALAMSSTWLYKGPKTKHDSAAL